MRTKPTLTGAQWVFQVSLDLDIVTLLASEPHSSNLFCKEDVGTLNFIGPQVRKKHPSFQMNEVHIFLPLDLPKTRFHGSPSLNWLRTPNCG